jgi:hypothetical protein
MNMGVEAVISEKVSVLGVFSNGILLKCSNSKTTINKSFVMEMYSLVNCSYIRQNSDCRGLSGDRSPHEASVGPPHFV